MCLYNRMIINRRYTKSKKNTERGYIPALIDRRIEYTPIGCGNCIECRKEKQREWLIRLLEDIKTNTNGKFITLTFSNEGIKKILEGNKDHKPATITRANKLTGEIETILISTLHGYDKDNSIATWATRHFNERWRRKHKKAIKHWLITELGHKGTENIHLHGIIWTNESYDEIEHHWKYGYIWPRKYLNKKGIWVRYPTYVNSRTISYTTKYVSKRDQKHKEYKPIILTSPGIGNNYTNTRESQRNQFKGINTDETYRTSTGHKVKIPTYWRNKIYTEVEKENLWIHKLDKEERWVRGEKVSIKNGMEQYNKMIQWHRRINHELGYGGLPNANRKEHEEDKREIMYQKRTIDLTWSEEHKKEIKEIQRLAGRQ